jgi:hypothetical protein
MSAVADTVSMTAVLFMEHGLMKLVAFPIPAGPRRIKAR